MRTSPEQSANFEEFKKINSKDLYSSGVVCYAEKWAELLELAIEAKWPDFKWDPKDWRVDAHLSNPVRFAELFRPNQLSHEADTEGVTGFMYGMAAHAISQFWIFGEYFRLWYNIYEGGLEQGQEATQKKASINPAVISIG